MNHVRLTLGLAILGLLPAAPAQAYVYWSDTGAGISGNGSTIGRANLDGSGVRSTFITGASGPAAVAVSGGYLYWANQATIGRANLDGTNATRNFLATGAVGGVAVDGANIYWTDGSRYVGRAGLDGSGTTPQWVDLGKYSAPLGIALDGNSVYVNSLNGVVRLAKATGNRTNLVTGQQNVAPGGIAVGGGYVYFSWDTSGSPTIGRTDTAGGSQNLNYLSLASASPMGVAVDGTHLYWADHTGSLGRATIGSAGATDVEASFVSDANGPSGIAVDAGIDPTATAVSCTPSTVAPGATTACKATVSDSASSSVPSGLVVFSGNSTTPFIGGSSSCTLTANPDGTASCVVGAQPQASGSAPVDAAYQGDAVHAKSSGSSTVTVQSSSGGGTGSTGGTGRTGVTKPKPKPACIVPELSGLTLGQAKSKLHKAHCTLGRVRGPRTRKKLVIASSSPAARSRLPAGAKVSLTMRLAVPPPKHRRP